ncbi:putative glycolipid-binding domain-containing protein [Microbacterium sp. JZ31]|uniref:putative glycolipid-binding domain-containing protein n=1 Tax=Microbacterium sp. JZ31 TaxID=1906274 RepID=UPI001932F258|nr:putative glycolipid-binding domain-containing protein [Microbacterium sp. JZ31]
METTEYVWSGTRGPSLERLSLTQHGSVRARARVELADTTYEYEAVLDAEWVFRALRVETGDGRSLELRHDASGWWTENRMVRPDLGDAVDIDLSFSPFTNTLPIRRLDIPVGGEVEIVTAYVASPSLAVLPDPQRYTRLTADRYLYESLDSDFEREILVDADGMVLDYPGLFTRQPA